ncbi:hypothetical protein K439DRAFT_1621159 [Ramaria rubella]|nr:hypothetical protein K439DRAFT_1621159 [Ramaria rubella]
MVLQNVNELSPEAIQDCDFVPDIISISDTESEAETEARRSGSTGHLRVKQVKEGKQKTQMKKSAKGKQVQKKCKMNNGGRKNKRGELSGMSGSDGGHKSSDKEDTVVVCVGPQGNKADWAFMQFTPRPAYDKTQPVWIWSCNWCE